MEKLLKEVLKKYGNRSVKEQLEILNKKAKKGEFYYDNDKGKICFRKIGG